MHDWIEQGADFHVTAKPAAKKNEDEPRLKGVPVPENRNVGRFSPRGLGDTPSLPKYGNLLARDAPEAPIQALTSSEV